MGLHKAVMQNNLTHINFFLDRGDNINKYHQGFTPLMLASEYSNNNSSLNAVKLLLDRGADINLKSTDKQYPALMLASQYSNSTSSLETVKLLLDRGADVNARNKYGYTALIIATQDSNSTSSLETVELLLDRGADVNPINNYGPNALMYAVQRSPNVTKLLLDRGADPFVKYSYGRSIIYYCRTNKCKELVAEYIWQRLYNRDMETAKKYARGSETKLPTDIWELILLNKRQQQLCHDLSSDKNKEILKFFAMTMNIPVTEEMTKEQLCTVISKQLAYGKYYTEKIK